jgi:hypothetical protein
MFSFPRLRVMGLQRKELPVKTQERLEESLLKNIKNMNAIDLSCFMKGSAGMSYEWNKTEKVKELFFQRFNELYGGKIIDTSSGRQIVSIIYKWGETGMKWEELSSDTQNNCYNGIDQYASSFDTQTVSNIIFG